MSQTDCRNTEKGNRTLAQFKRLLLIVVLLISTVATLGEGQSSDSNFASQAHTISQEAIQQLSLAIRLTIFSVQSPSLNDLKFNAARIMNVLVGADSPLFNEDVGIPQNADRTGVIPRLARISALLAPHAEGDARVQNWLNALESIEFFSAVATEEMINVLNESNDRTARVSLRKTIAFLTATRGSHDDPLSEGGARALEQDIGRDQ